MKAKSITKQLKKHTAAGVIEDMSPAMLGELLIAACLVVEGIKTKGGKWVYVDQLVDRRSRNKFVAVDADALMGLAETVEML